MQDRTGRKSTGVLITSELKQTISEIAAREGRSVISQTKQLLARGVERWESNTTDGKGILHGTDDGRPFTPSGGSASGGLGESETPVNPHQSLSRAAIREAFECVSGVIAHDLNNYLTNLTLLAETLIEQTQLPQIARQQTECLLEEVAGATGLVRQLLTFAKSQPTQIEEVNLLDTLKASADFALRGMITTYDVEGVAPDERFLTINDLFQQILSILILHAARAAPKQAHLNIRQVRLHPDWLALQIGHHFPELSPQSQPSIHPSNEGANGETSSLCLHFARSLIEG